MSNKIRGGAPDSHTLLLIIIQFQFDSQGVVFRPSEKVLFSVKIGILIRSFPRNAIILQIYLRMLCVVISVIYVVFCPVLPPSISLNRKIFLDGFLML
jgi:hypothetical protein